MNENLDIFLTVWGAILSTLLGVFTLVKYKKDYTTNLFIIAKSEIPFEFIEFSISNKSKKPITLTEYSIGIGSDKESQKMILKKRFNEPIKLGESDIFSERIERKEIIENVKSKNIVAQDFQRIWLNINLSTQRKYSEMIYINPEIISKDYYKKAEQFIASDIFIGFKQKESKAYPIGINK